KGVIHWLCANNAIKAEIRLLDRLFSEADPDDVPEGTDWKTGINPDSLKVVTGFVEPTLQNVSALDRFQFERLGYFSVDYDSKPGKLVFNRTATLKDTWAKISSK
ncbi:MAG: glutamine--tRNA ligase, partial [Bacteroidales bacterium]|nr:glutamine--tRNA ligase [Bacteroidales bacterium]